MASLNHLQVQLGDVEVLSMTSDDPARCACFQTEEESLLHIGSMQVKDL